MIRLRRMLERGRKHPVLGPVVLVLLVLLLAMVCFHAAHDGWDGAVEMGAVCVGIAAILAAVAGERSLWRAPLLSVTRLLERGPPRAFRAMLAGAPQPAPFERVLPLRR